MAYVDHQVDLFEFKIGITMRVIYTGGTFDLFHAGHVSFLRKCRELAGSDGHVIVAVNRDAFVARYKRPPIMTLDERIACLRAVTYVNTVVVNIGDEDSKQAIECVRPTHLVIGDDWKDRDYHGQMRFTKEWLEDRGIELVYVPYTTGISTTELLQRHRA
ncbi:MAG: cytidyltransferase-like protein [Proteobacteria bacterium]|uniref:Cytidyltransferase-like protein n=1 Tax=Candidatus Fonsibacter lacus TaxID=2576439 RepID=A0A965GDL9_9PROT|nr:cytidyltransferase-like protein [Candidatus Fonsibacter lacus]NDF95802.1 cytidyltransferase-like protein [Pseudomonadota bacterium]